MTSEVMRGIITSHGQGTGKRIAGAPAEITGPNWARTHYDHLKLPNGLIAGDCPNELLRQQLSKFELEEVHTAGRETLLRRYGELLAKTFNDAGTAAVDALLKSKG